MIALAGAFGMKLAWRPSHTSYRGIFLAAILACVLRFFGSFIQNVVALVRAKRMHLTRRHSKASYIGVLLPTIYAIELWHIFMCLNLSAKIANQTAKVWQSS